MIFSARPIKLNELDDLIEFDKIHLLDVMKKIGIPEHKCSLPFNSNDLLAARNRGDILLWIFLDENLAGYMWREKRADCLFGLGLAIKQEFYGLGLCQYAINLTEKMAKEAGLASCQLAVIPENGRVISAYLKQGYKIIKCIRSYAETHYLGAFRCIMEKSLRKSVDRYTVLDRIEVLCVDEEQLMQLTTQGYVGVAYKKSSEHCAKNKIVFEKRDEFIAVP